MSNSESNKEPISLDSRDGNMMGNLGQVNKQNPQNGMDIEGNIFTCTSGLSEITHPKRIPMSFHATCRYHKKYEDYSFQPTSYFFWKH